MLKGYRYHIVISYAHTGEVCEWVHNHFLPVLNFRLGSILDEEPQIFIDKEIEVGTDWPEALAKALHHSY